MVPHVYILSALVSALPLALGDWQPYPSVGGVSELSAAEFIKATLNPNATGHYIIAGYDVSNPYPGIGSGSRSTTLPWGLDINVTADISTASSDSSRIANNSYIAGASVKLVPPPSLVLTDNNGTHLAGNDSSWKTWRVCMTFFFDLPASTYANGKNDDGSCSSLLGSDCAKDLAEGFFTPNQNSCGIFTRPKSCEGAMSGFNAYGFGISLNDNLTRYPTIGLGPDTVHSLGNNTDYNILGGHPIPVVTFWQASNYTNVTGYGTIVSTTCLRANNTVAGSQSPSAASSLTSFRIPAWSLLTLLVTAVLAFGM